MLIVADDKIPFLKGVFEPYARVVYLPGSKISPADVREADALIVRTRTRVGRELLEGSQVKAVVSATIGTDHMDIPWLEENHIAWANAPGCNSGSVMQYIASVFAVLETNYYPLSGKTLGIVGVGNVGSKVKKVGEAFGMKVVLNDPPRQEAEPDFKGVDLNVLLQMSDVVSFHVPLQQEGKYPTFHLLNDATLMMMKRGSVLINTSRGEVVEERVMKKGISSGIIEHGILDVWENEPDISRELQKRLMIGTPHIAGYSVDGKANGTAAAVRFISGQFDLALDNWFPAQLPVFDDMNIVPENDDKNQNKQLASVVLPTYDVRADSDRLADHPENFEEQRGNYPVRREFPAWTLQLSGQYHHLKQPLKLLGFHVVEGD